MKSIKLIMGSPLVLAAALTVTLTATPIMSLPSRAQFINSKQRDEKINWQYLSPEKDKVYGIDLDGAYGRLAGMKPGKQVVVAVIGPGIDREHEDMKGSLWINPREKDDAKDNDRNGKVDDRNGWNFLGNGAGEVLEDGMRLADREFLRLNPKYEHIFPEDGRYYTPRADEKGMEELTIENPDEYRYFFHTVRGNSRLNSLLASKYTEKMIRSFAYEIECEMKEKYPGQTDFSREDMRSVVLARTDTLGGFMAGAFLEVAYAAFKTDSWRKVTDYFESQRDRSESREYLNQIGKMNLNDRKLVGDNPLNIKDTRYGNNVLSAGNSGKGTSFAGLIAAGRSDGVGIDGIADNARVMTLRILPQEGEWIPKDLALAIRYAVDSKADIILLPNPVHMRLYKEHRMWIEKALEYAASKNVLVIQPVTDNAMNIDTEYFAPNRTLMSGNTLKNVITVAASDKDGNPLMESNFGAEGLDVFAPGKDIYAPHVGASYRTLTGSDMAAAVTAGVAALVKSYYPKLSAEQLREVLMNSVTDMSGAEVEKQYLVRGANGVFNSMKDLLLFEDLCASKGIVNAAGAVAEAARVAGSKR